MGREIWIFISAIYTILCFLMLANKNMRRRVTFPWEYLVIAAFLDMLIIKRYTDILSSFEILTILLIIQNIVSVVLFIIVHNDRSKVYKKGVQNNAGKPKNQQ